MRRDETIVLMGEEVGFYNGAYKVSKGMLDEFGPCGTRHPITELGLPARRGRGDVGLRPIVEMMTFNFSMLALDQIVNSAPRCSTCRRAVQHSHGYSRTRRRGPSTWRQHSQSLESWFCYVRAQGCSPATPADAKGLLKASIRDNNPVVFIESEVLYGTRGKSRW